MDVSRFGRVAILYGGHSGEREISLLSGQAIYESLISLGIEAHLVDPSSHSLESFVNIMRAMDRAFIALHGDEGENGRIQALLELLGIPYTGSGVAASAVGMDKMLTKSVWRAHGIPTPFAEVIRKDTPEKTLRALVGALRFPIALKPHNGGSSLGVFKIETFDEFKEASDGLLRIHETIMAEAWIQGREFAVSILGETALQPVEIVTTRPFYDYEAKYKSDTTQYFCPARLTPQQESDVKRLSLLAFQALRCRGWGRLDVLLDTQGDFWFLEVNVVPGMTRRSLVPKSANEAGISFDQLVLKILEQTLR